MSKQNKNNSKIRVNHIYNMDCLDGLKKLPDKSVDLAFIDPPFNTGKDFGVWKDNLPKKEYLNLIQNVINELRRVSKRGFAIYMDWERFKMYRRIVPEAEPIIICRGYYKLNFSSLKIAPYYYIILTTAKALKPVSEDFWNNVCVDKKEAIHHPQTPIGVVKRFLEYFSKEKDLILDCFMGSGTTAVACKQLGRNFIGFEINSEYYKIANERIKNLNLKK